MARNQSKNTKVNWGICTNTGGKADGTPCSKCQNKEKQAIRVSKDFVCEECGEPLIKTTPKSSISWQLILGITLVIGLIVGGFFLLKSCDSKVCITVIPSNETMGIVKGSGEYKLNQEVSIEAIAKKGYSFVNWTKNEIEVSTYANYTFMATEDGSYVANFALNLYTIVVTVYPDGGGTVIGAGTYYHGETAVLTAIANEGYQFVSWNDGCVDKQRKIIAQEDETYKAEFEMIKVDNPPHKKNPGIDYGTYNHEWFTYEGPMQGGRPHGEMGKVTVTKVHNIEIGGVDNFTITVYPGETITTKFENGRLRSGEIHHKDGSNDLFTVF